MRYFAVLIPFAEMLIIGWLPGAVLFRLPWLQRDRRAALDAEERVFWAVMLSVGVSLSVGLFLAALDQYSFPRLLMGDVVVAAMAAVASRLRLRFGSAARRPGITVLIPLALVVLGLWRFFPPAEYVTGGKDPGTYMNEGIQIAQRGSLVTIDQTVAAVPEPLRDLFFPSHESPYYYSTRFIGFFIRDPQAGTVIGQFPQLFPVSLAIGYGIDGLTGARRTVGVWGVLGLLALYFCGARLVGRPAAAAAAVLLAFHVLQVWYARYPNSEIMMQALLLTALLAADRAIEHGDRFFGAAAGALLGLQIFLRYDVVLAFAAVGAAIALGLLRRRPIPWWLVVPATGLTLAGLAYLLTLMTGYSAYPLGFTRDWVLLPVLAAALALAVLLWSARQPALASRLEQAIVWALVIGGTAAAIYAWQFRSAAGRTAAHDAMALRTFTQFYLSPAGLIAALAGYAYVMRRSFTRAPALLLTLTAFASFFFYKLRVVPEHFWMGRRFLAIILPGALVLIAAVALSGLRNAAMPRRLVATALGFTFLGLLGNHYARTARPVLDHVEYAGLIPKLEALAARFGDRDLVVAESGNASASDIHFLALPLAYIYARNVLVLATPVPDKTTFAVFLEWARNRYDRVFFLGGGGSDLLSRRWTAAPVASERFRVPEYQSTRWDAFPRAPRHKDFEYGIYEFGPAQAPEPAAIDLDIGILDDLHVVRFGAKEETEGRSIRWSGRTSWISLMGFRPENRTVTIWMNDGGRPPSVAPAQVEVHLEDVLLGTATVSTGFKSHSFSIPADLAVRAAAADPPRLKLVTNLWNPHQALGTGDTRDLGVMVDRVQVH